MVQCLYNVYLDDMNIEMVQCLYNVYLDDMNIEMVQCLYNVYLDDTNNNNGSVCCDVDIIKESFIMICQVITFSMNTW
jgi:hypothetical protein